jgi:hypothetical protein
LGSTTAADEALALAINNSWLDVGGGGAFASMGSARSTPLRRKNRAMMVKKMLVRKNQRRAGIAITTSRMLR